MVECVLVLILILVLWWCNGLVVGILRMRWHLGMVFFEEVVESSKMWRHTKGLG